MLLARWGGALVVSLSVLVGALTLIIWSARGSYPLTGDEPHYLVIGEALWRFGGIDVAAAYETELLERVFYPPGLGEPGAALTSYGHVVPAATGDFSWHGYLLGWIAGAPVAVFGAEAARWVMVVLAAGIAWLVWFLAGLFFAGVRARFAVAVTLVLTYPFLLASVLVFPDFVAGGLALLAFAWLMARARGQFPAWSTMVGSFLVALLPWLGLKFAPVAAVLLLAMAWRAGRMWWQVMIPSAVSAVLFAVFNTYAYGSPFGSLAGGAVQFTSDVWLRLVGMLIDQDQGALLFNPILWLGIAGVIPFLRRDRFVGVVWLITFGLVWVLGAAHPGWYGGGSFIGRYSWGLALLLMLPTMTTLVAVHRRSRLWCAALLGGSLVFSAWVAILGWFVSSFGFALPLGLDFFTKPMGTWLESYTVLWFPVQGFLPAIYDPAWAWRFPVNYGWLAVLMIVVVLSFIRASRRLWLLTGVIGLIAVVMLGLVSTPGDRSVRQLQDVQVLPEIDQPGVIAGGPVWVMRDGPYLWNIAYSAELPPVDVVGRWELVRAMDEQVVAKGELLGTSDVVERVNVPIAYRSLSPRQYFLRIAWIGAGSLTVVESGIDHARS
jgi:hypothetical protein